MLQSTNTQTLRQSALPALPLENGPIVREILWLDRHRLGLAFGEAKGNLPSQAAQGTLQLPHPCLTGVAPDDPPERCIG